MSLEVRFCLGQISTSLKSYQELIENNQADYDLFELWLDYISELDLEELKNLLASCPRKLVLLTRRNDQKNLQLDSAIRKQILDLASKYDCIVDLDYKEQRDDLDYYLSKSRDSSLLISYHNYSATPTSDELSGLLSEMSQLSAEYYKLACVCQSRADVISLLDLYQAQHDTVSKLIVLGAGEHGTLSRVAALLWQQPIIYAPKNKQEFIVQGQLTRQQYRDLEKVFND